MEFPLPLQQKPLSCGGTQFKIKPVFGFLPHGITSLSPQHSLWSEAAPFSKRITASADFSRRRRRISTPKTPESTPKGFAPRTQVGISTQRKDQKNNGEKEGTDNLPPTDFGVPNKKTIEAKQATQEEIEIENTEEEDENGTAIVVQKDQPSWKSLAVPEIRQATQEEIEIVNTEEEDENGTAIVVQEDQPSWKSSPAAEIRQATQEEIEIEKTEEEDENETATVVHEDQPGWKSSPVAEISQMNGRISHFQKDTIETIEVKAVRSESGVDDHSSRISIEVQGVDTFVENVPKPTQSTESELLKSKMDEKKEKDDSSLRLKLENEAALHQQTLERLAEENFLNRSKLFYYPEVVRPDHDVEVFLNRSLSTLNDQPDVLIIGGFNDWRWKSFTSNLNKTDLPGDWWACQVHVPKEAYKLDFVFYNGKDVYDNNDENDFCITINGGMTVTEFEDFLLEEKRKELEKLAKEQAERERQEEEQKRIEAEKAARETDRALAREEARKSQEMLKEWAKKAIKSLEDVWHIEPSDFKGGDKVKLFYNKSSGPLKQANDLWLHAGHNKWKDGLSIIENLVRDEKREGDWWYGEFVVPDRALVLDWVFADGSPQQAKVFDNNHLQDFHAIVPRRIPEDRYWSVEEYLIFQKLQEERRVKEAAIRAKAEKTARMKAETKERTLKTFLLSQKDIVYTEPLDVKAGNSVTVFYNPSNTVLNGKPEVWLRCSFNRWTYRVGLLPPQRMLPVEGGSHVKATVKVPLDAYMMDFVFSERENGGIFDNKNGMDYHIPVSGGVMKEPPMHIVHIAVEMAPIAKVGGLGDVVTSLSRAVQDLKHNVDIILPKYDCLNLSHVKDLQFQKSYSWGGSEIKVWFGKVEGLSVYFLEPLNGFFWAGCIYGCRNDGERFGFFCHAALEFLLQSGFHPDVIHCHDWSSAPVAWLFKEQYMHYGLSKARVVFTIHNLEFGAQLIGKAVAAADKATTVSPTYAQEVSGNPAVAPHLYKFHGILNGIDPDIWDPYNDKFIPISYTPENVVEGKRSAKEALQQKLGLKRADLPLVGIITRLTHQKGIHLIKHAIWRTLDRGGQVVLLGSAPDPRIQNDFVNLANQLHSSHHDRARLCLTYDEPLSHLIYAGSDFILVPSIFEPCGLTQLTAMRYGSIPVVRKTGGLYDTVFDVDHDKERAQARGLEPNGFNFDGADAGGVDYALNRAISAWYQRRDWFNSLCKRVMEQDWSWNRPALDYLELYHTARK